MEDDINTERTPTTEEIKIKLAEVFDIEEEITVIGWRYAELVDYDFNALKPLLDRDVNFISEMLNNGGYKASLEILQLELLKKMNEKLDRLTIGDLEG